MSANDRDEAPASNPASAPAPSTGSDPSGNAKPERRGPPPNPLYHPLFLPVLLVAFTLWFGWDGFLTTDPEMLEHQTFNRIMYLFMQPICFRSVPRGIQEFCDDQRGAILAQAGGSSA